MISAPKPRHEALRRLTMFSGENLTTLSGENKTIGKTFSLMIRFATSRW
jgi:hypothetical protein